jgi:N-acetylmuramoyl-L-alanine amidase
MVAFSNPDLYFFTAVKKYKSGLENATIADIIEPNKGVKKDTSAPVVTLKQDTTAKEIVNKDTPNVKPKIDLFYTVQILTSPVTLSKDNVKFKGVDVWEDQIPGMFKYCTGRFLSFADALRVMNEMKAKGFTDAFIAAYRNGQRITLQEAKKISSIK